MQDSQCIELFEKHLREEKKASPNTVSSYMRDIHQLSEFLTANTSHCLITAKDEDLQSYISVLRDSGLSVSTVSRSIASIKCLYMHLCIRQHIKTNPSLRLTPEKQERKLPDILTHDEVELLLSQPEAIDAKGYRDKALLELLYATGIRVSELIDLNIEDIDLAAHTLQCSSGSKTRLIPVYEKAITALDEYIRLVRPQMIAAEDEKALFVNVSGERMSRQGLWKIIKSYSAKAGIDKDITPHTLRHSFAAHMIENGADVRSMQEILGHSDLSSTHSYSGLIKSSLMDSYNKAHPHAH